MNSDFPINILKQWLAIFFLMFAAVLPARAAERINQEGRILGPLSVVTNSILFDTSGGRRHRRLHANFPGHQRL